MRKTSTFQAFEMRHLRFSCVVFAQNMRLRKNVITDEEKNQTRRKNGLKTVYVKKRA